MNNGWWKGENDGEWSRDSNEGERGEYIGDGA